MRVLLVGSYEMGRQPFGVASPAAWLREAGFEVACADLSQQRLPEDAILAAEVVAFYVPMHTATRIAAEVATRVHALNPRAHLAFYGLYAPVNAEYLTGIGAETILGGEFEAALVERVRELADAEDPKPFCKTPLVRLGFRTPDRSGLPPLSGYAHVHVGGDKRVVGYTESTRGCKHLCRHCPVVPVYQGRFFVVAPEVVLRDIEQQVSQGARHITFGDPDFLNAPRHARRVIEALHARHPDVTYDVTAKVEHLLRHRDLIPELRDTGCLFVTTAVESFDDAVLELLDKGHTRADFLDVLAAFRKHGVALAPTFVAFGPWTTLPGYADFLGELYQHDLIDAVAPIQLALRLLVPAGSRLLEHPRFAGLAADFDARALAHPWRHEDPRVDGLQAELLELVEAETRAGHSRRQIFARAWERTDAATGAPRDLALDVAQPATIPFLTEPWYC